MRLFHEIHTINALFKCHIYQLYNYSSVCMFQLVSYSSDFGEIYYKAPDLNVAGTRTYVGSYWSNITLVLHGVLNEIYRFPKQWLII